MAQLDLILNFKPFILYEAIVCINFPNSTEINSSCMGVHFTPTQDVYLHVYSETDTQKLLKNGVKFSINFTDNIMEYAQAALFGHDTGSSQPEIDICRFDRIDSTPVLKSSWSSVLCEVIEHGEQILIKPPCKRREIPNIRSKINKIKVFKLPIIFNNRSMNLAIESLILATRIPLCEKYSQDYNESLMLYKKYKSEIEKWRDMDRFERAFEMMDNYLIKKGLKPQEVFDY